MTKYEIRIIKIKESESPFPREFDEVLFDAEMDSDDTIEILYHLWDLNKKRK